MFSKIELEEFTKPEILLTYFLCRLQVLVSWKYVFKDWIEGIQETLQKFFNIFILRASSI